MNEDYENYTDDDYVDELKQYAQDIKSEQAQDEAERRKQLAEMVGGYMGLWWYLRSFSSSTARNIRTYAAVADREAKIEAWTNGTPEDSKSAKLSAAVEERAKKLTPFRDLPGSKDQKVMLVNEFGACTVCAPYVGKTYTLEEAQELVPFHPNCRCTLVRVTKLDEKIALTSGGAASANNTGKTDNKDTDDVEDDIIDSQTYVPKEKPTKSEEHKPGLQSVPGTAIKTYSKKSGQLQRIRIYGPNGAVLKDIDYTNHGISEPEVHDWTADSESGKLKRGNGRKLTNEEANYIEGIE